MMLLGQTSICEAAVVLGVGTAAIVGLAAVAARLVRQTAAQQNVWQAAVLSLLGLVAVELSGAAPAMVGVCRHKVALSDRPVRSDRIDAVESPKNRATTNGVRGDLAVRSDRIHAVSPLRGGIEKGSSNRTAVRPDESGQLKRAPGPDVRSRRLTAAGSVPVRARPTSSATALDTAAAPESNRLWPLLGLIWACGVLLLAARIVWSQRCLRRFRRSARGIVDPALAGRLTRLAARLGLDRPVTAIESPGLKAPVAFGYLRPTVALPVGFHAGFDPAQQEAILAHELAHLASADSAWQLAADVACAALWWHPAAWWAAARLRAASELAADEASLLVPGGPHVLAGCLVTLGRQLAAKRRLGWLSVEGPSLRSALGRRVQHLLQLPAAPWRSPGGRRPAAVKSAWLIVMLAVAIGCTAWARPQADLVEGDSTMSVLKSSFGRSLAAAVVAAVLSPLSSEAVADGPADGPPKPDAVRRRDADRPREAADKDRERPRREADAPRRDQPPRAEGDQRRRGEGPEAEAMRRQIEVMKSALPALRQSDQKDAMDVLERAIRAQEVTLERRRDDEAQEIREHAPNPAQLGEVLRTAFFLLRDSKKPDEAEAVARLVRELGARRDRPPQAAGPEMRRDRPPEADRREGMERARRAREEVAERRNRALEAARRDFAERSQRDRAELAEQLTRERDKIREKIGDLERRLAELRDDQGDEARDLRAALDRSRAIAREVEGRLGELNEPARTPPLEPPPPEAREEIQRRLDHIRAAVDNLHAAGLHEQAEQLEREAERMARKLPPRGAEPPGPPCPPEDRGQPQPPPEELGGTIHDLRGDLERMQHELEEMRGQMERMRARLDDDDQ